MTQKKETGSAAQQWGGAFCKNAINKPFFKVRLESIINRCNRALERQITVKTRENHTCKERKKSAYIGHTRDVGCGSFTLSNKGKTEAQ